MTIAPETEFMGVSKRRRAIITSILTAVIIFFYFFSIGSAIAPQIYSFTHRVTYVTIFSVSLINNYTDSLIMIIASIVWFLLALKNRNLKSIIILPLLGIVILSSVNFAIPIIGGLFTLPIMAVMMVLNGIKGNNLLEYDASLSRNSFAIITVAASFLGIIGLILEIAYGIRAQFFEKYAYAIFQELLSLLTPILMAMLIFCIPVKIVIESINNKWSRRRAQLSFKIPESKLERHKILIYLTLCIGSGLLIVLIPHYGNVNSHNERLGVDTPRYVHWIDLMRNQTTNVITIAFKQVNSGDRPLTILTMFLITKVTNLNAFQISEYSPLLLSPLLILATFLLTRELTSNDTISLISAFLSSISFQTLIGVYSGFLANWLSLILSFVAFALIFRYLKKPSCLPLILLAFTMSAVLLSHSYTWSLMLAIAFVILLVLLVLKYYPKRRIIVLFLILMSSVGVDVLKSSITGGSTGLESDISVGVGHGFGTTQFSERLNTLADLIQTYYGGIFANIAILGASFFWLIRFCNKEISSIFMMVFLTSALVPLFLGDWVLQSRVLYNIPFQIPAAIGLFFILKENHKIVAITIILVAFYLSFHVLVNLGFVPSNHPLSMSELTH